MGRLQEALGLISNGYFPLVI